ARGNDRPARDRAQLLRREARAHAWPPSATAQTAIPASGSDRMRRAPPASRRGERLPPAPGDRNQQRPLGGWGPWLRLSYNGRALTLGCRTLSVGNCRDSLGLDSRGRLSLRKPGAAVPTRARV